MNRFRSWWSHVKRSQLYSKYEKFKNATQDVRIIAVDVAKFMAFYHLAASYVLNFTLCIGPSMMPTLKQDGDIVLIDLFSYKILGKHYAKGDVVVSICPTDPNKHVCKRILATEGERVVTVRHNGFFQERVKVTIPPGHVWLAGDNVENSTDSRAYGPVPIGLLQGRVFVKFGPSFFPPFTIVYRQLPNSTKLIKNTTPAKSRNAEENVSTGHSPDSNSISKVDYLPSLATHAGDGVLQSDVEQSQQATASSLNTTLSTTSSSGETKEKDTTAT